MNQDFIDWLNSADNANDNTSQGTGLLIAPLSVADPQTQTQDEIKYEDSTRTRQLEFNFDSETHNAYGESNSESKARNAFYVDSTRSGNNNAHEDSNLDSKARNSYGDSSSQLKTHNVYRDSNRSENNNSHEGSNSDSNTHNSYEEYSPQSDTHNAFYRGSTQSENNNAHEDSNLASNTHNAYEDSNSDSRTNNAQESSSPQPESEISNILQELRHLRKQVEELDTPQISYEEPPPETWGDSDSDSEIESELYEHYEQGIDFQEYNDRTPHGTNFTRRLQRILHERKERAAEEKLREDSRRSSHPYIAKGILLCLSLIAAFLFAVGVLVYLQKRVPNFINTNVNPDSIESIQEEKLEDSESESKAQEINNVQITQTETNNQTQTQIKAGDTNSAINHESRAATPLTFEDYLHEGNEAFNLGIYNAALKNFFRALELDDNDTRPYIGLAGAFRAKGLYFDAKRILDEAMMIFRKNPTIETALKILEGDSKHGTCKCNRSK